MATTHDIADLKAQFDERIGHLREGFGVLEADINRLGGFQHEFTFSSLEQHQQDDNDVGRIATDLHQKTDALVQALVADEQKVKEISDKFVQFMHDTKGQLDTHLARHVDVHHIMHDAAQAFSGNIEQVTGELDHAHTEYVNHVQEMHQTFNGLAEKLFGAATSVDHSVRQAQTEALNQASTALHTLIDSHLQGHIPTNFQEAAQQLTQHVHDLGEHATAAGNNMHNEIATFLQDMTHFAQQEVHDKIEAKFKHLMEEALAFLMQEITETIVVVTTGVTTTAAMSEIIPVLAVLKHALDGIKEAIKIFKTLEEIF